MNCGTVGLVGRPNVGKSSLMNALLGADLAIVSPKAQTTRHQVRGVLTRDDAQIVFVDTPGQAQTQGQAMNRLLDRAAHRAMQDVDVLLVLCEAGRWQAADQTVLDRVKAARPAQLGLVLTKIDKLSDRASLLPEIGQRAQAAGADFVVPVSAHKRDNLDGLLSEIAKRLPAGPPLYDPDTLTPHSGEFLIAEMVREQIFRRLHQELPYATTVTVEQVEERDDAMFAQAVIWVNRDNHKGIVIGKGGQSLKGIGRSARARLSGLFGCPVHLRLWVKVRAGWADNEDGLRAFGYGPGE